jgi:pimeloyl-ACP methyl ester carboxylesterase
LPHANIQNVPLYYEEQGKGTPLVFIHGLGLSHATWRGQVNYFSERYRVITYDIRGHGRSGISTEENASNYLSTLADDLRQLLAYLEIDKAHFVTYSAGSLILFNFLHKYGELSDKAVLTGAFPSISNLYLFGAVCSSYLLTLVNAQNLQAALVGKSNGANPQEISLFTAEAKKTRRAEALLFLRAMLTCEIPFLAKIPHRLLLLYGANERHMMCYRHKLLTSLPRAEVCLIPKTPHACPTKACSTFNRLVEDFISEP